ncbi:MAG: hypothetical protein ACI97K_000902 [Glaciecola sp.]|jgi:hypothetical protein
MQVTKMLRLIGVAGLSLCAASIFAIEKTDLPSPFLAKYDAYRHDNNVGSAELSLKATSKDLYELKYSSKVSRFFLSDKRYETTLFSFADGLITPVSYAFKRKGTGPNKSLNATFDNDSKTIIIKDKENLEWNGELDNQLFRIDISRQLAQGKNQFTYKFLNYRGQKRNYQIEVVGKETLQLPYGVVEAVKVKVNRESKKRQTFAWYAPSLDFVLVRLQQFKEGEEQGDIRLKTYQEL